MGLDEYTEITQRGKELEAAEIVKSCEQQLETLTAMIEPNTMGLRIQDLIDDAVALCSQARYMIDARTF